MPGTVLGIYYHIKFSKLSCINFGIVINKLNISEGYKNKYWFQAHYIRAEGQLQLCWPVLASKLLFILKTRLRPLSGTAKGWWKLAVFLEPSVQAWQTSHPFLSHCPKQATQPHPKQVWRASILSTEKVGHGRERTKRYERRMQSAPSCFSATRHWHLSLRYSKLPGTGLRGPESGATHHVCFLPFFFF